jgi:hypothetical protein
VSVHTGIKILLATQEIRERAKVLEQWMSTQIAACFAGFRTTDVNGEFEPGAIIDLVPCLLVVKRGRGGRRKRKLRARGGGRLTAVGAYRAWVAKVRGDAR